MVVGAQSSSHRVCRVEKIPETRNETLHALHTTNNWEREESPQELKESQQSNKVTNNFLKPETGNHIVENEKVKIFTHENLESRGPLGIQGPRSDSQVWAGTTNGS
jgi:hypothetical protein